MKNSKFLIVFCAVFLSVVLIAGGVLIAVVGIANSRAVMHYEGHRITRGVYSYFASTYKTTYIASLRAEGVEVSDTPEFWASEREGGVTYSDAFEKSLRSYVASILGANVVHATYARYTRADRLAVKEATEAVLADRAGGSVEAFNSECAVYGFDYDDFCDAAEMIYKMQQLYRIIYGEEGSGIAADSLFCENYFTENYTRVKLLFIRTRNQLETNEAGEPVLDEDGKNVFVGMSPETQAKQLAAVEAYKAAVDALHSGADGKINGEMFEYGLKNYDGTVSKFRDTGHYFSLREGYTQAFPDAAIRDAALALSENDFAYVPFYSEDGEGEKTEEGVCFLWRVPLESGAYTSITYDAMFGDFYQGAAESFFEELLAACLEGVTVTDKMEALTPAAIPYNSFYKVVF